MTTLFNLDLPAIQRRDSTLRAGSLAFSLNQSGGTHSNVILLSTSRPHSGGLPNRKG